MEMDTLITSLGVFSPEVGFEITVAIVIPLPNDVLLCVLSYTLPRVLSSLLMHVLKIQVHENLC